MSSVRSSTSGHRWSLSALGLLAVLGRGCFFASPDDLGGLPVEARADLRELPSPEPEEPTAGASHSPGRGMIAAAPPEGGWRSMPRCDLVIASPEAILRDVPRPHALVVGHATGLNPGRTYRTEGRVQPTGEVERSTHVSVHLLVEAAPAGDAPGEIDAWVRDSMEITMPTGAVYQALSRSSGRHAADSVASHLWVLSVNASGEWFVYEAFPMEGTAAEIGAARVLVSDFVDAVERLRREARP